MKIRRNHRRVAIPEEKKASFERREEKPSNCNASAVAAATACEFDTYTTANEIQFVCD